MMKASKPIRIFTHVPHEHPGYLCEYLDKRGICYEKIQIDRVKPVLKQVKDVSGLVFLGSPVSVNDPLPWIAGKLDLTRRASQTGIPMLGICFGGQLISKALGGEVTPTPSMQIGWHHTTLTEHARALFKSKNGLDGFSAFEWHGDTFSLPDGALPLFTGDCIRNQGFVFKNSLALQFHPEITETMVHEWIERYAICLKEANECIQSKAQMLENIDERLARQQTMANLVFDWWLEQVFLYQALQGVAPR